MDIYLDFITKLKLVLKFIVHKYQQFLTTTYEFEIVNTSKGPVRGRKRINIHSEYGKYYAFEGIPFAKPPLRKLRFRAPQPPEPWQEVLDCTNCKAKPMQYNYAFKLKEGSEDCLYLNVYARELHTAKPLPVMVWIYGGGFQIGEASRDMYAPDYFMQRDVILVTFNYRLGIFGFLCFDDPELNIPGNAGLKDQVLALRWVKDNIHNFNGDANNITVFGESAGGASTHFLMSIPRAKGLFHKAIVQSASMLCPWATTEDHDWAYKTACLMGYNGDKSSKCVYDYLSRKSSHDLYLANYQLRTKERDMRNVLSFFIPVVEPYATDDCVISKPPKELLAEAWGNKIPLIIGGVLDEGFIFYNMARHVPYIINELGECLELMPDDLKHSRTQDELKQMALSLKQLYFDGKDPNIRDNFYHFLELMGHRMIWHPIVRTLKARLKYASLAPTYVYTFDFDSNFFNHHRTVHCGRAARGVCHGDDLVYLFYGILSEKLSTSSREYQCLQRMVGMWYNFALTSNPNCQEIEPVIWQPLGDCEEPLKCLSICDTLKHKELPKYEKLKIWNEFYKREEFIYTLVINTSLGRVKGQKCEGIYGDAFYSFEKIPFGEIPVGKLRFLPPQPKSPWSEILDCTLQAPKPMQKNALSNLIEGTEDCLYLNIYTKQLNTAKPLPVIVLLYGGGFEMGDPTRDLHGPDYFMMKDVVFVTIGYRLGPFGFLQFKDPQLKAPGNNGLKDQLLALQWIKQNIANFNGDVDNITLSGESAGAASTHYLMCCPLAKGLFHKAILMSGNILCNWAYSPLENIPYRLAKACGYENSADDEKSIFEFLQQQPAETLLKPYLPNKEENMNDCLFTYGPKVEPYPTDTCVIPEHPESLVKNAWGNAIPVLMSGTSFEGLLMFARVHVAPFLLTELEENPHHCLPFTLKMKYPKDLQTELGMKIKKTHFGEEKANALKYCEYATYKVFWHPILRLLKLRTNSETPLAETYLYRFDFDSPDFNHQRIKYCGKEMRGVAHVDDHSYLFYGDFSWKLSPESSEYKTIQRMVDIWHSFALQSNPNGPCVEKELNAPWLPVVKEQTEGNLKCLNIGKELKVIDLPEMPKLQVWESLYNVEAYAAEKE
ncbi:uncharacterized protein LOC106087811 [Stomoxys calcitrans]|uniref:uncharacterized protein LOC106087811 n=1 Tax=Stomoxys calcitrans TaxID=35570 RepID=UPI0027E34440|nr:uncharacterized protein LOC106087811 [Stomoxys calcitrans]